jgi:tetratricopeptide (TPR) repeat protein
MSARRLRVYCSLLLFAATAGCAQDPGVRVADDVGTMRAERSVENLVQRGRAFADVGDLTRAEQYLAAALEAGAPYRSILPLLLRVCVAERRFRVAIDYAEPIMKKQPEDHGLRVVLASLYAGVGDTRRAREQLEAVLRRDPELAQAHYILGVILRESDADRATAAHHFREYLRIKPNGVHAAEAKNGLTEGSL